MREASDQGELNRTAVTQPVHDGGGEGEENNGLVIRLPRIGGLFAVALVIIVIPLAGWWLDRTYPEFALSSPIFLGYLMSFSGALLAVLFIVSLRKKRAIRRWSPITATVVESEAVTRLVSNHGHSSRTWAPRFTYRYEVGGQVYRGRRISFFKRYTGLRAQEFVTRHPVGQPLTIYFDPARPANSVLDRSFPGLKLLPILAAVFGTLAVVCFKLHTPIAR